MISSTDKDFYKFLKLWGIPDDCTSFSLHAEVGEVVKARCEYHPHPMLVGADGHLVKEVAEFELVRNRTKPDVLVTVGLDVTLIEPQIRAMQNCLAADNDLDRRIELGVLSALCEIQRMADDARRELGIAPREVIGIRLEVAHDQAVR
jgi:hypothetical protein